MSNKSLNVTQTAFAVFDLPVIMTIDLADLDVRYRRAQGMIHPDRFIGKTPFEQKMAAQQAIQFNDAYQKLKKPLLRAQEILKAHNIDIPGNNGGTIQNPELLMEVMDWREKIDTCQSAAMRSSLEDMLKNQLNLQIILFDKFCEEGSAHVELRSTYLRFVYLTKMLQDFS